MKKGIVLFLLFVGIANISAQIDSLDIKLDSLERVLNLKEVTVTAKAPVFVRKTDRLVFNVENSVIATGGDVMEALRITPGLQVKDDKITMIGKSGMSVMVDERLVPLSGESLISYLRSIPTASIKSIEVISMPPAKYDAAGNSGIVNIVLKKARNNSWNMNVRGSYTQATYASGNGGIDFNYKKDKLSIFSNLSGQKTKNINNVIHTINYPFEKWVSITDFVNNSNNINFNSGLNYDVTNKWKMGMFYNGNLFSNNLSSSNTGSSIFGNNEQLLLLKKSDGLSENKPKLHSANIHSITYLDTLNRKLSIDFDYFTYTNKDSAWFSGSDFYSNGDMILNTDYAKKNTNNKNINNYSLKFDVELPYEYAYINVGGKVSFSQTNNTFRSYNSINGTYTEDINQSNQFRYNENTQALYASAQTGMGNIGVQFGLRLENTLYRANSITLNQNNPYYSVLQLFPTLYLVYGFKENSSLSLSYGRRTSRPYFSDLNPFRFYLNSLSYVEGNPDLKPSYSNNLELVLNTQMFEHKIWYSYINNDFQQFPFVDASTNVTRYYTMNFVNYYSIGFSESLNYNKLSWWHSYNNAVFYYINKKSKIAETLPLMDKFSGNLTTNNDFFLNKNKTIVLNVGFYYELPFIDGYANVDALYSINSSIRCMFLNKKLTVSLSANDILKSQKSNANMLSNNIQYNFANYPDSQQLRITINYKFGNNNINSEQRNASNQEEKSRIGK